MNATENIFEPKLRELKVRRDELSLKLGFEFGRMMNLNANFFYSTGNYSLLNNTRLSFLGFQICYQFSFDTISFTEQSDYTEISFDFSAIDYSIKNGFYDYSSGVRFDFGIHLTEIDLFGIKGTISGSEFSISHAGVSQNVFLRIFGHYNNISTVNGKERCGNYSTIDFCQVQCRIKLIQKSCNCTPSTWSSFFPLQGGPLKSVTFCFQL